MKIISVEEAIQNITLVTDILNAGGVIIYPTDTVYGLGTNATNQKAVDTLLAFKGNRQNKAISIAVKNQAMAEEYIELNDTAKKLYKQFLPGPVTIVSQSKDNKLAKGVSHHDGSQGVRIIPNKFVETLVNQLDFPITATSGNVSGAKNTRSLQDFLNNTTEKKRELINLFIDAGELPRKDPSTVIKTIDDGMEIVRQGELKVKGKTKKVKEYLSKSEEDTQHIAQQFISEIISSNDTQPTTVLLQGQLGAGKTVFTKALAKKLGITEPMRSPTYMLYKEYSIPKTLNLKPKTLFHIDAWRMSHSEEFDDLGLDSMLQENNITIIEWPQRLTEIIDDIKQKSLVFLVNITVLSETKREITIQAL